MRSKLFLALLIAGIPVFSFAQLDLKGTVKDKDSGITLAGATVTIENSFLSALAGSEGNFEFKDLKAGTYIIRISYLGYENLEQDVNLTADNAAVYSLIKKATLTDEVVVTSTRFVNGSVGSSVLIDYADVEKQNMGQDLPILLDQTPSVVTTSDAGAGVGYTGIRIRGSDASRVNVTINGIPVNDAESAGTYFVDLPDIISSADNIQIQRGVGTSTNGAGAFGGSVNIKTTGLNAKPYGEIGQSYGSFNTLRSAVKCGTGLIDNKFAFDARLSKITSDGYIDRGSSDLRSFYFSGGYFGKSTVLKAIIFSGTEKTYQCWYGVPQDSLITHRTFNPAGMYTDANGATQYYKNETDNYQQDYYQLHFSQQLNSNWNFNAALHYTYGRGYYEEYVLGQNLEEYGIQPPVVGFLPVNFSDIVRRKWLDNDFYGTTFSLNYSDSKKLMFTFGGAANKYLGRHINKIIWAQFAGNSMIDQAYASNDAEKTDMTFYTKLNYNFTSKFSGFIDLQFRGVDYSFSGFDATLAPAPQDVKLNFINPKFGLNYDLSAGKNIYAFFGIANKEPNRDDYVQSSPASRPKPENMQDVELGYQQKNKNTEFGVNGYWMNYTNQLVLTGQVNDVGAYNRTNVSRSYREGVELTGGIQFSKFFKWNANLTYSSNKIRNFSEFIDNYDTGFQDTIVHTTTTISFSPDLIAGSKLTFVPIKEMNITIFSKFVGRQFLDNTSSNDRKINDYFVNDLLVSYSLHPKWMKEISFTFKINNMFNQLYQSNGWTYEYIYLSQTVNQNNYYPQAGTNYLAGLILKFGK